MTSCSLVVTLSENANAERFASWMAAEKEEVVFAVDGGNFGRPLTAVGVQKWWAGKERFFMEQRGWKILEYRIFDIVSDAQVCGHIEVGIFSGADPELNVATAHCGVGATFAWLLYVYILPSSRDKGIGMAAVVAACREAFHLGASSTLLIVQEANLRARRFYERVGFSDTGKSMTRSGRSFILIEYKNKKVAPAVALVEEQDAECLAAWLGAENLAVQHAVDGGDFGRPISPAGIRGFWSGFAQWCRTARSREALAHRVFVARVDGVACGHIEIGVLRSIDTSHNPVNSFCEMEPFAVLLYVYVLPEKRRAGVGLTMVRLACEQALQAGAKQVVLLVEANNLGARRFYARAGFKDTGVTVQKAGATFLLIACVGAGEASAQDKTRELEADDSECPRRAQVA